MYYLQLKIDFAEWLLLFSMAIFTIKGLFQGISDLRDPPSINMQDRLYCQNISMLPLR